jgi:hypothetical protein
MHIHPVAFLLFILFGASFHFAFKILIIIQQFVIIYIHGAQSDIMFYEYNVE